MARTFPTVGISPIDAYVTDDRPAAYFEQVVTLPDTTLVNTVKIVSTPTMISSGVAVGLRVAIAPAGTLGSVVDALYVSFTEDTTKRVWGYFSAAEFELVMGAAAHDLASHAVLVLDYMSGNTSGTVAENHAYIMFREYSSGTKCKNLFSLPDATDVAGGIFEAVAQADSDHGLRIMVGSTPYWIMLSDTA